MTSNTKRRAARANAGRAWLGLLAAVTIGVGLLTGGCDAPGRPAAPASDSRLGVVATTTIVADLVRSIGGERVAIEALMGPGVDPHLYKPSAGDVRRMSDARAVFFNGLHLEGKMGEVLEAVGRRGIRPVAVAECVPKEQRLAVAGFEGLDDPHVWFDVQLWRHAIDCARDALVELDPEGRESYEARAAGYHADLEALDAWVRDEIERVPETQRVLVTAHDAFSYFGRAYDFEVLGLLGVSTAAEAGTADVQRLAATIAERRIPAIFVETSVPPRYVQALQEAVAARGFDVVIGGSLLSDSLGDREGPAGTYAGAVRANVETIVTALTRETGDS
jgi:manganese/zinc/iron transport system substrate-binding protein